MRPSSASSLNKASNNSCAASATCACASLAALCAIDRQAGDIELLAVQPGQRVTLFAIDRDPGIVQGRQYLRQRRRAIGRQQADIDDAEHADFDPRLDARTALTEQVAQIAIGRLRRWRRRIPAASRCTVCASHCASRRLRLRRPSRRTRYANLRRPRARVARRQLRLQVGAGGRWRSGTAVPTDRRTPGSACPHIGRARQFPQTLRQPRSPDLRYNVRAAYTPALQMAAIHIAPRKHLGARLLVQRDDRIAEPGPATRGSASSTSVRGSDSMISKNFSARKPSCRTPAIASTCLMRPRANGNCASGVAVAARENKPMKQCSPDDRRRHRAHEPR